VLSCDAFTLRDLLARYPLHGTGRQVAAEKHDTAGTLAPVKDLHPLTKAHHTYLRKRDLCTEELILLWDVQSFGPTPSVPVLCNRICIPLIQDREWVSFQARTHWPDAAPRYWTCPSDEEGRFHKHCLYGWDYAKELDRVVVVEGPVDVWKLGPGAVHGFGSQLLPAQVLLLSTLRKVYFLFDSEEKAQTIARGYCEALSMLGVDAECLELLEYPDPGDIPAEEAQDLMKELGF